MRKKKGFVKKEEDEKKQKVDRVAEIDGQSVIL